MSAVTNSRSAESMRRDEPDPGATIAKALLRAASALGLRNSDIARVVGTSEASVSRLSRGRTVDPASKEGELALLFIRLFRSLDAIVGGNEAQARAWLHAHNHHVAGIPADRIRSVQGLVDVVRYLDAMRGRV